MLRTKLRPPVDAHDDPAAALARTCADCGVRSDVDPATIHVVADIAGNDHVYGTCPACIEARTANRLAPAAAHAVLGVDVDDPALIGVRIEAFSASPVADCDQPNTTPWAHVDRRRLADTVNANREAITAQTGGPCWACGCVFTPFGTRWTTERRPDGNDGPFCGACQDRELSRYGDDGRCYAASVLVGFSTDTVVRLPANFGPSSGLLFFYETGRTKGGTVPWAHVDARKLRSTAAALILARQINAPSGRWHPDTVGTVEW